MICYCSKILIMLIPPIVPEDGVLWRFPVWSLAECYHCGAQEEHLHTVGDSFRGRRRWQGRACRTHPLWDDGIQHAPGVTLWQILVGLQRVQHSGGPQSLHTARRFVLRCSKLHTSRSLRKLKGEREGEYFSVFVKKNSLTGMSCEGFPGPGVEHHMLANPMKEFIHTSASGHSQRMFNLFKDKFQRRYSDEREHERRQQAFVHNLRWEGR